MFRFAVSGIGTAIALFALGLLAGCSTTQKTPAVSDNIRKSLEQAGLKDVSVTQDRDKGVVTLGGHVGADADKANAGRIAQSLAVGQVVANQVAVLPQSDSGPAKA